MVFRKQASPREIALYREGLAPEATGAPALLGTEGDTLLLEHLPEQYPDLRSLSDISGIYRHLAAVHRRFAGRPPAAAAAPGSPWLVTAAAVESLLAPWTPEATKLALALTAGPVTLVHGDYYRWNLVLQGDRVRVLDWEMAAAAHPIWDLLMLQPDLPPWDGAPGGAMAAHALETYHAEGLLGTLPWQEFSRLHAAASLFEAARQAERHRGRAAAATTPGAREVMEAHASQALKRAAELASRL